MHYRVLLIGLDEEICQPIASAVRSALSSSTVTIALNGHEALVQLGVGYTAVDHLPDFIFLNLHVRPISGFDILRAIRTEDKTSELTAIAMLKTHNNADIERARQCGASSCILMPKTFHEARKVFSEICRPAQSSRHKVSKMKRLRGRQHQTSTL